MTEAEAEGRIECLNSVFLTVDLLCLFWQKIANCSPESQCVFMENQDTTKKSFVSLFLTLWSILAVVVHVTRTFAAEFLR